MKRIISLLLPLGILALLWGCRQMQATDDTYKITGKLTGADDRVPAMANVLLTQIDGSLDHPLESVQVGRDGQFALAVQEPGAYRLYATATNHRPLDLPVIWAKDDRELQVNLTLSLYDFVHAPEEVKIIGSWNNFKWGDAEPMQKQADGTFIYEPEVKADSVGYQLLGITKASRSVNGTMADFFEFDGGGDYRSMLLTGGKKVKIVFDPKKLPKTEDSDLPKVTFDKKHQYLSELFDIENRRIQAVSEYRKAYSAYEQEHGNAKGFEYTFSDLRHYLKSKMLDGHNPHVRQFAAMQLGRLYYYGVILDSDTYNQIARAMSPESQLWIALEPTVLGLMLEQPQKAKALLEQVYAKNPSRSTQAEALGLLASLNRLEGNQKQYQSQYADLIAKYEDQPSVEYLRATLDPDNGIAWGKPVPEFEVKLLDSGETVSNKSLLGQFYLIDFWATWCRPCIGEMPHLHEAYQKYKNSDFNILSLSLDKEPKEVKSFRETRWNMPWMHACLHAEWDGELVKRFNVDQTGIPSPFLVSPQGRILATHEALRGPYLERTLQKYLSSN